MRGLWRAAASVLSVAFLAVSAPASAASAAEAVDTSSSAAERGAYVFDAAGCAGCHTKVANEGGYLAGGRRLATPFGTFVTPNITPDATHGIGGWTLADFVRALREGRAPDGSPYYPSFPYTSYAGMTDDDIADLYAYLQTQTPQAAADHDHELDFPFNFRPLLAVWQWLNFEPDRGIGDPARSGQWNRGAYLVEVLGHCGECHSPRTLLGAVDRSAALSGNPDGPEGARVPGIGAGALADWSESDIAFFLSQGVLPDGDYVGGAMAEVVKNSTSRMRKSDLAAIANYLMDLPRP